MSRKKTIRGKGLWDFDTTPPSQLMTDRELAEYKRDGLPIPTYALDVPDAEMYANLYGTTTPILTPTPIPTQPKLVATSTSSSTPQLRISPDMYFLNPIPSPAERRAMELSMAIRDLEREVRELKQSTPKKKKTASKKRKKKKTASKKRKKRSKSK